MTNGTLCRIRDAAFTAVFLLASVLRPAPALAWGSEGHRIVCGIAWDELKATVRFKVEDLLSVHSKEAFADSCNWADEQSASHPDIAAWHVVNVPMNANKVDVDRDCALPRSCSIVQIGVNLEKLRGRGSRAERAAALKFVANLMGDIHEPLQVAPQYGKSGVIAKGRFMGRVADMRQIWETELLADLHRSWQDIAHDLHQKITPNKRHVWIGSVATVWADESLKIALDPSTHYVDAANGFELGPVYERAELPVVYDRLSRAGVRLASLINEALLTRATDAH